MSARAARGVQAASLSAGAGEFAARLRALGVNPRRRYPWLMVGTPTHVAGWKLHVSADVTGVDRLLDRVLPCLARRDAHFKMAAERDVIVLMSGGSLGERQIGKVITVYPRSDAEAVALARELIEHSRGIDGPRVATDLHLGGAVYARYGSVRPRVVHDRFGEPTTLIPDGNGNWVSDLRSVPFSCPPGIGIPFRTPSQPSQPPPRAAGRKLLAGRYFVTDVLRPGLAGSVLRAIDLHEAGHPAVCVLKQARPFCSADALGRDRRARLRHEGAVLSRLHGVPGIARAGEYFEDEGIGYLPIAYVQGRTLGELVYRLLAGRSWLRVQSQTRHRLLRYVAQLIRRLRSAHARGVIHRDIAPANVWIGADEQVYLLDWECAHVVGSRTPAFQLGTPGFSGLSQEPGAPNYSDDWHACARVLAFVLTGLNPAGVVHGQRRELGSRLAELTQLRDTTLIELLAGGLTDGRAGELDGAALLGALGSMAPGRKARRRPSAGPLFTATAHESVLAEGLEKLTAGFRMRLDRLQARRTARDATLIDAHSGIAGLLYVLAAAHVARVAELDARLAQRAVSALTARTPVTPDLPGLVHGRAGRALAAAAAVQAGCVAANDGLRTDLAAALSGPLDWPDFTHGAAGQGFAALACARRLGAPELGAAATRCAAYLVRTQNPDGSWTLPEGVRGSSGERYTGFAHGAAGIMAFLGTYAALVGDATADAAWRRAESWLVSRARHGRGGKWQWPQSDSRPAPAHWWCHGAPGIALGWLCVAQAQGTAAISEEYLRGALAALPTTLRSDSLSQCHGLAGVGEIYLEAHCVLGEECWRERAADIATVLVALFRRRSREQWRHPPNEPATGADGLMLGTAGILHFLLRHQHAAAVTHPPLLA